MIAFLCLCVMAGGKNEDNVYMYVEQDIRRGNYDKAWSRLYDLDWRHNTTVQGYMDYVVICENLGQEGMKSVMNGTFEGDLGRLYFANRGLKNLMIDSEHPCYARAMGLKSKVSQIYDREIVTYREEEAEQYRQTEPQPYMKELYVRETILGPTNIARYLPEGKTDRVDAYVWKDEGEIFFAAVVDDGIITQCIKPKRSSKPAQTTAAWSAPTREYRKQTSSPTKKKDDPYDVYRFDDPDDFADEWADEFGDGDWDDGYDEAWDYWMDHH